MSNYWFFRLTYLDPTEMDMIALGEHEYTIDYNGLININGREYHQVELNFTIDYDEYSDYAVPVSLPVGEGSIIIEDDDIYIE